MIPTTTPDRSFAVASFERYGVEPRRRGFLSQLVSAMSSLISTKGAPRIPPLAGRVTRASERPLSVSGQDAVTRLSEHLTRGRLCAKEHSRTGTQTVRSRRKRRRCRFLKGGARHEPPTAA